ncbi:MAG: hypothetical protein JNL67_20395 [Planctomycetaceae bacterium]|nr:hypothetical protein [Planctomycetaceae bacterium]
MRGTQFRSKRIEFSVLVFCVIATQAMAIGHLGTESSGRVLVPQDAMIQGQATVGSVGRLDQVMLPGSLLRAKPLEDRDTPMVVRVVDSFQHGDSFRYNLTFMALEPGRYDLRDWLERADGSPIGELPAVPVEVVSVLEPGHVLPHELDLFWPQIGSYRFWMILAAVFWVAILLALIFWPKPSLAAAASSPNVVSLADLLQPRLLAAASGQLNSRQLAELERWLVEFWRRRLGYTEIEPRQALIELRQHPAAGPLLKQLERWLHSPNREAKISLSELLAPYVGLEVPGELEGALSRTLSSLATGDSE